MMVITLWILTSGLELSKQHQKTDKQNPSGNMLNMIKH